jgi:hypothetical protein
MKREMATNATPLGQVATADAGEVLSTQSCGNIFNRPHPTTEHAYDKGFIYHVVLFAKLALCHTKAS